jgi:hypothetical protein
MECSLADMPIDGYDYEQLRPEFRAEADIERRGLSEEYDRESLERLWF